MRASNYLDPAAVVPFYREIFTFGEYDLYIMHVTPHNLVTARIMVVRFAQLYLTVAMAPDEFSLVFYSGLLVIQLVRHTAHTTSHSCADYVFR
jgi:hypothetical protein